MAAFSAYIFNYTIFKRKSKVETEKMKLCTSFLVEYKKLRLSQRRTAAFLFS